MKRQKREGGSERERTKTEERENGESLRGRERNEQGDNSCIEEDGHERERVRAVRKRNEMEAE